MNVSQSGGIDIGKLFNSATQGLAKDGEALQAKMDALAQADTIDQKDMLQLQFEMGQYNAKLEALSSMTKSMQDMLKSLAQRTG